MTTPFSSIVMFLVAAAVGAAGQFLYRAGAAQLSFSVRGVFGNAPLWGGVACYIIVMVLFLLAYKRGGSLAVLYPVYASTFIFGALIATWTDGYRISSVNLLGMACLVVGMALLGAGQRGDRAPVEPAVTPRTLPAHTNADIGPQPSHVLQAPGSGRTQREASAEAA